MHAAGRAAARRQMLIAPHWMAALHLRRGWSWNAGHGLRLRAVLLQPRDLFRGPVANVGHLDPCVVLRRDLADGA
jgi:hypothetical protein